MAILGPLAIDTEEAAPRLHVDRFGDSFSAAAVARLCSARFRPGFPVFCLAASPDGKQVAAGGPGGVYLRDSTTGESLTTLESDELGVIVDVRFQSADRVLGMGKSGKLAWEGSCANPACLSNHFLAGATGARTQDGV